MNLNIGAAVGSGLIVYDPPQADGQENLPKNQECVAVKDSQAISTRALQQKLWSPLYQNRQSPITLPKANYVVCILTFEVEPEEKTTRLKILFDDNKEGEITNPVSKSEVMPFIAPE